MMIYLWLLLCANLITGNYIGTDTNPYYESLEIHVDSFKDFNAPGIDTFFVKRQAYHRDYDEYFGEAYVKTLSEDEIYDRTRRNRYLLLVVISPIMIEDGEPIIYVTNYDVRRKRKQYQLSGADVTKIKIVFDCELNIYKTEKIY